MNKNGFFGRIGSELSGLRAWEIVLLILGFPIWFPLIIAAFAVILSLYISLWAVIISLWAVFGSVCACVLGFTASGIGFLCYGHAPSGIAMIASALICAGLSIFLFFGCRLATSGVILITKKAFCGIKKSFSKMEAA